VRCTARTSDTLTILRGQEGTSDATKAAGIAWTVELVPTAKMIQNIDTNKVEKTGDTMTGTLTATKLIPSGNVVTGNGMYLPAANTVAFSTNGAERVRVISTGEVGIAKTPTAGVALDVTGAVTASGLVTAGKLAPTANTTAGNGMYLPTTNQVAIGTDGTEAMRIDASQNTGFGVTAPASRVHMRSATSNQTAFDSYRWNSSSTNTFDIEIVHSTIGTTRGVSVFEIFAVSHNSSNINIRQVIHFTVYVSNSGTNASNIFTPNIIYENSNNAVNATQNLTVSATHGATDKTTITISNWLGIANFRDVWIRALSREIISFNYIQNA
jgi:hypothetical protein